MKNRTYNEWNELGYYVIKGEKSKTRDQQGTPLFSEFQVTDAGGDDRLVAECTNPNQ